MSQTDNEHILKFLYKTFIGRLILKILTCRLISKVCGLFLSSFLSKGLIKGFIKRHNIDMSDYEEVKYRSFNDFFTRKIKEGRRPINGNDKDLISPSDGLLSAYHIDKDLIIDIKNSKYSVSSLLRDDELASSFEGGSCIVIRLCVDNYHRYCYPFEGKKGCNKHIKGVLHTVRPIALENVKVFTENSREYTVLENDIFDQVIMMEVGALLVGKIANYHEEYNFKKGEEKGMFLFGGSTIILLVDRHVNIDKKYFASTSKGIEEPVKMGCVIGGKK